MLPDELIRQLKEMRREVDKLKLFDIPKKADMGGGGDVVGPNGATSDHLAVFDGATGKLIKDGGYGGFGIAFPDDYILIQDEKSPGDGGTNSVGVWATRDLNTKVSDTGNYASVSSNQFTLQPGTYVIKASAPSFQVGENKAKLYNVTDMVDVIIGTDSFSDHINGQVSTVSVISGKFTITSAKVFEIRHIARYSQAGNGWGVGYAGYGVIEVFTTVELWRQKEVGGPLTAGNVITSDGTDWVSSPPGAAVAHNILSSTHGDALTGSVLDGSLIIGNVTPKWSALAIVIPTVATVRNIVGVDYGELRPSWKTALDTTNPATLTAAGAAAAGTSLVFAHRDHVHAITGAPALLGNGASQYQTIITGATPFAPVFSGFLLDGTTGGKTVLAVNSGKVLTLTAVDNFNLTIEANSLLNQDLTTDAGPSFAHLHLADVAAIYTAAESWIGPSSTTGIYFKGGFIGFGLIDPKHIIHVTGVGGGSGEAYFDAIWIVGKVGTPNGWNSTGLQKYIINGYAAAFNCETANGRIAFYTAPSGLAGNSITFTEQLTIMSTGVGVGVASPGVSTKLQVAGMGLFTGGADDPGDGTPKGVAVGFNTSTNTGFIDALQTAVAPYNLAINQSGGNVGIGTTTIPSLLTINGLINMKNYTVATLPAGTQGDICYCTDLLLPGFLAVAVGGGAVVGPVFKNATQWVSF